MPTTRSGWASGAAISVTERAEVLVASTVSWATTPSIRAKRSCLTARSSNTASITRSQPSSAPTSAAGSSSPSVRSFSSSLSRPFSTLRASCFSIMPRPRSASSIVDSQATVGTPAWTHSWAIPDPIVPSPTTPTFSTVLAFAVPT